MDSRSDMTAHICSDAISLTSCTACNKIAANIAQPTHIRRGQGAGDGVSAFRYLRNFPSVPSKSPQRTIVQ